MGEPTAPNRHLPIIRVFVSSTFSDLVAERNALAKDVWPELEDFCRQRGFTFQAIDLRWGVPSEAGLHHRTMGICFEELRRAQETSPEPNFLILLGNKYGWRPLPETITETEFKHLRSHAISQTELDSLKDWYRRDGNARPDVQYVLRARPDSPDGQDYTNPEGSDGKRRDTQAWLDVQDTLWQIVNRAYPGNNLVDRFEGGTKQLPSIARFQSSATEQEIWHGALQIENARDHVVAWFREIDRTDSDPPSSKLRPYIDLLPDGSPDADAADALRKLKSELQRKLAPEPIKPANCRWAKGPNGEFTGEVTNDHLAQMCEDIQTRLETIILRQIKQYWGVGPEVDDVDAAMMRGSQRELDLELRDHGRFAKERGPVTRFVGREAQVQEIREYLRSTTNRPFIVHGPSGSGKTALLAYVAQRPFLPGAEPTGVSPLILTRFLGTHPDSSTLHGLLTSLCRELRVYYPVKQADGHKIEVLAPLPESLQKLLEEFYNQLAHATLQRPIYVFLDALDQLDAVDAAREVDWLWSTLSRQAAPSAPVHARVVASCLSPSPEFPPDSEPCRPYRKLKSRDLLVGAELGVLNAADAQSLLRGWLSAAHRGLTEDQWKDVIRAIGESSARRQPLYLKVLVDQLARCREFDPAPELPHDLSHLLEQSLRRLSEPSQHDVLPRIALGYLVSSRYGLSEGELLEVLFSDEEIQQQLDDSRQAYGHELPEEPKRYPIAPWARLRSELRPYLSERAAPGTTVLCCYHRQVEQAIRKQYLETPEEQVQRHQGLARYFKSVADPSDDRSWLSKSIRGFHELPYQLASFNSLGELVVLLGDLAFAAAKSAKGACFDLLNDYDTALSRVEEYNGGRLRLLQLKSIVRREAERLSKFPECSLQQMLLEVAAIVSPDVGLRLQATELTQTHRGSEILRIWSLVPEHHTELLPQAPANVDRIVENVCATQTGMLVRYRGGEWVEYSTTFEKIRSGLTPAALYTRIAHGGDVVVLASAATAAVWNPWPAAVATFCKLGEPISAVALSDTGSLLALGGAGGSIQVRDTRKLDAAPLLCEELESPIKSIWFLADNSVMFIAASGVLAHTTGDESWRLTKQVELGCDCWLACSLGGDRVCVVSETNDLLFYGFDGSLRRILKLPAKAHSLASSYGNNGNAASVFVGLVDGSLHEFKAANGVLIQTSLVSELALQSIEFHSSANAILCRDAAGAVFLVPRSGQDEVEFRTWPDHRQILAANWDESAQHLETVSPEGKRLRLQKCTEATSGEWKLTELSAIDGPLDNAWILPNGDISAQHRESDESQIWLHSPVGSTKIRSRCLWRAKSFLNLIRNGPSFIHAMAVSRCGTYFAAAENCSIGKPNFRHGKLGRFTWGGKWQTHEAEVAEFVLSDRGEVVVMTRRRGASNDRIPARILICRSVTHVLLDDGWGGGISGTERGAGISLMGTAISRDGRVIAAIDAERVLWLFSYDPKRPKKSPRGSARLQGVVSISLSDSGTFCAALRADRSITVLQIKGSGDLRQLAVVLPSGQPSCIQFASTGRHLIVTGHGFVQAVSF